MSLAYCWRGERRGFGEEIQAKEEELRVIAGVKRKRRGVGMGTEGEGEGGTGTEGGTGVGTEGGTEGGTEVEVGMGTGTEGGTGVEIEVEGISFTINGGELICKSSVRSIGLAELVERKVVGANWEEEGEGEGGWLLLAGEMSKISFD